ncbi:MAG: chemotaxis-specific protein-glutamate methyltransferase CheB [Deltaproteobacteria bacterium]|nr:chemotaxis-specific protein-glutamate methyltransferase CheB [Deltaproteobacteria bacterium]
MKANHHTEKTESRKGGEPIRVLIVDDVKSARDLLVEILTTDPRFQVVGAVADGLEAVAVALKMRPDLVTMDIRLPGIDGFQAVEKILAVFPVPIVMITASMGKQEEKLFRAITSGALDVLDKQELYLWRTRPEIRNSFLRRLRTLASTRVKRVPAFIPAESEPIPTFRRPQRRRAESPLVVAIAASTGGPTALVKVLRGITPQVNAAFLVVQHMSKGFLEGLVRWLDNEVELEVKKAQEGDSLEAGVVLVAPGDHHMMVTEVDTVRLDKSLPINGHRPSAEMLFDSVASSCGKRGAGVILTGMGSDGAEGLKSVRLCGGHTIAQDEQTSIIFGMPRAAIELDAAEIVLPLEEIGPQIMRWISEQKDEKN